MVSITMFISPMVSSPLKYQLKFVSSSFYNASALNSNYGHLINVRFNCLIDTNASNCDGASSYNYLVSCNCNIRNIVYHNICLNSDFRLLVLYKFNPS